MQDRSLDLLMSSPVRYHCTTDAPPSQTHLSITPATPPTGRSVLSSLTRGITGAVGVGTLIARGTCRAHGTVDQRKRAGVARDHNADSKTVHRVWKQYHSTSLKEY